IDEEATAVLRNLGCPETPDRPLRPLPKDRADRLPVDEVARVKDWKLRPPLRCSRGRPEVGTDSRDRGVWEVARLDGVRVGHATLLRVRDRSRRDQTQRQKDRPAAD